MSRYITVSEATLRRHLCEKEIRAIEDAALSRLLDAVLVRAVIAVKDVRCAEDWIVWARAWLDQLDRTPGSAVDAAHKIGHSDPLTHALHQLAWAAKESCYGATHKAAPWLVLRYVADAAVALGINAGGLLKRVTKGEAMTLPDAAPPQLEKSKMNGYVYVESEHGPDGTLYTVGFYDPKGEWHPESDHSDRDAAASRVNYLNGGR